MLHLRRANPYTTARTRFEVFDAGDYEECRVMGCGGVWVNVLVSYRLTFLRSRYLSYPEMEATSSSEKTVYNKPTRRHIPEEFTFSKEYIFSRTSFPKHPLKPRSANFPVLAATAVTITLSCLWLVYRS